MAQQFNQRNPRVEKRVNRDNYINLRVTEEMRDNLRTMAEEDQRTITNMCSVILNNAIQAWKLEAENGEPG